MMAYFWQRKEIKIDLNHSEANYVCPIAIIDTIILVYIYI